MYEDLLLQRESLEDLLEEGEGDYEAIRKEIGRLNQALGDEAVVYDDLIDKWEQQLEAGEIPDLNEGLHG